MSVPIISFSCSPQGQDAEKIIEQLKKIKRKSEVVTLYHTFKLTAEWFEKKSYPSELMDAIKKLFPDNKSFVAEDETRQHAKLVESVREKGGTAYIVGRIKGGAHEEYWRFMEALPSKNVVEMPLNESSKKAA